jgi:ATPase family associated with various cellular activities (AAA)
LTLRQLALAALAPRGGADLSAVRDGPPELRFLELQRASVTDGLGPSATLAACLEHCIASPCAADVALVRLGDTLGLRHMELAAVALCAAVEDDVMTGRAIAQLQAPLAGSRPTLGLLASRLAELHTDADTHPLEALATGRALGVGLLSLGETGAPLPERPVSVPAPIALALLGLPSSWPGTTVAEDGYTDICLPQSVQAELERQAGALLDARRALVIRASSPEERRSVAATLAGYLRQRAVFIETEQTSGLGPWLLLRGLLPAFLFNLVPGERKLVPAVDGYNGPLLVLCGPDGSVEIPATGGAAMSYQLPVPDADERARLWCAALGEATPALAERLAHEYRCGAGRIAQLGYLARHQAAVGVHQLPTLADVVVAARSGEGTGLEGLALPLHESIPDEALVATPQLRADLDALLKRCKVRDGLVQGLGASAVTRYAPGVRALFVGPSGTGKTLAAGWLATRLGLPLYRVDLASITSKYIGETEKNLSLLLARAEHAEVVLLFDEADSLFGKRTDVSDANDRFANAQTNYLLQRIESFAGITLLTSNSRTRFDAAFSRRLDVVLEFPVPGPEERRLLWQSHIGQNQALSNSEINRLAASADLVGGHIRNVVLTAAVLAQSEHRQIVFSDILFGLTAEYRKLGRQVPSELSGRSFQTGTTTRNTALSSDVGNTNR